MRVAEIKPLTGIRIVACVWIVLHHSTMRHESVLAAAHPDLWPVLRPVLAPATIALDLFFMLSGYVLALNYLTRVGERFDARTVGTYVWLRICRIWPVYALVLVGAGLLIALRARQWGSVSTDALTVDSFWRQLLMIQVWGQAKADGTSWSGPAWSISAEWLAYLLFPVLALLVLRLRHLLRARTLLVLAHLVMVPLVIQLLVYGRLAVPYGWSSRVLLDFTAGMLLYAAVDRGAFRGVSSRLVGLLAPAAFVATLGWFSVVATYGERWMASLAIFAAPAILLGLSVGSGPLQRVLATRAFVVGGGLSFALYLIHGPAFHLFRDVFRFTRFALEPVDRVHAELAFVVVLVAVAYLIFTRIEEPARRTLQRLPGVLEEQRRPAASPGVPGTGVPGPRAEVAPRQPART